jgi:hypothetical protein
MSNLSQNQSSPFDSIRRIDEQGNECWFARELMPLLGSIGTQADVSNGTGSLLARFREFLDRFGLYGDAAHCS